MASPTQWTWVWASSGSWWWTGKAGVLQSTGKESDMTERLNWSEWYVYLGLCVFTCASVCIHLCICVSMYVCLHVRMCMSMCVCVFVLLCVSVYICVCVCGLGKYVSFTLCPGWHGLRCVSKYLPNKGLWIGGAVCEMLTPGPGLQLHWLGLTLNDSCRRCCCYLPISRLGAEVVVGDTVMVTLYSACLHCMAPRPLGADHQPRGFPWGTGVCWTWLPAGHETDGRDLHELCFISLGPVLGMRRWSWHQLVSLVCTLCHCAMTLHCELISSSHSQLKWVLITLLTHTLLVTALPTASKVLLWSPAGSGHSASFFPSSLPRITRILRINTKYLFSRSLYGSEEPDV